MCEATELLIEHLRTLEDSSLPAHFAAERLDEAWLDYQYAIPVQHIHPIKARIALRRLNYEHATALAVLCRIG